MTEVRQVGAAVLLVGGGVRIRAPGPISAVEVHEGIVAVLTRWVDLARPGGLRRIRTDNLYGFDELGTLLWRVRAGAAPQRPLMLTGFLEDATPFTLHEASGWWIRVDPRTGRVIQADCIA